MCYTSTPWVVLASEPCYKVSVDGALSEENERSDLGLLLKQGEDDDHEAIELEANNRLSPAMTGEVLPRHGMLDETPTQISRPALVCSPLLIGRDTLLSPLRVPPWC